MKLTHSAILVALALGVSACGTENRGLESVHQPVVNRADYSMDIWTNPGGLAAGDTERLSGWFESLQLGFGDKVSVDMGSGYDTGRARDAIAGVASRYGILLQNAAPLTTGELPQGAVRVVVSRLKATVPGCPDWSRSALASMTGHSTPNYGCATNSNLAAMVADPEDLVRGKTGSSSADASTAYKAVDTYRKAEPSGAKGLKQESGGTK